MNQFERQLFELERGLSLLDTRVANDERRVLGLGQSLQQAWVADFGGCTLSFAFTVKKNSDRTTAIPNVTVDLYDGSLTLVNSGVTDANGEVTLGVSGAGAYTWTTTAVDTYIDYSGTAATGSCGTPIAVGVFLDSSFCARRLSQHFSVTESYYGVTVALTYSVPASGWLGCTTITYPAGQGSTCTNTGTIGLHVRLDNSGVAAVLWDGSGIGHLHCPVIGALCNSGTNEDVIYDVSTVQTCPYPATVTAKCSPASTGSQGAGSGKYIFPSPAGSTAVCSTLTFTEV